MALVRFCRASLRSGHGAQSGLRKDVLAHQKITAAIDEHADQQER